eukprot:g2766.t1
MLGIVYFCLVCASAAPPPYKSVLSFGDSWAYLGDRALNETLSAYGAQVHVDGIPGTPAAFWSTIAPKRLVKDVTTHKADAVLLSIGGDDFLEGLPFGLDKDKLLSEMLASTTKVLDALFAAHPDVHVYQWGYEILDWSGSSKCKGLGDSELKSCCCPKGWADTECMTKIQADYLQTRYVDVLAAQYSGKHNYHSVNVLGSLQVAGGVAGAAVGKPNWGQYSPTKYVYQDGVWACLHLTHEGFAVMYQAIAKQMGF